MLPYPLWPLLCGRPAWQLSSSHEISRASEHLDLHVQMNEPAAGEAAPICVHTNSTAEADRKLAPLASAAAGAVQPVPEKVHEDHNAAFQQWAESVCTA